MKSLFAKIMLSLVVSVLIALALVVLMTRVNLNRGMIQYIERQEATQLAVLVPELAELYTERGSWEFLQGSSRPWNRLLRIMRAPDGGQNGPPPPLDRRRPDHQGQQHRAGGNLRGRLFLLDADQNWVAGAPYRGSANALLERIEIDGEPVGYLGFIPLRKMLPPEARLFLHGQSRALLMSLVVALVVAFGLGVLLARHFSRPLRQLAETVDTLSDGNFDVRATVTTKDEIGRLGGGVNKLAQSLASSRSARQRWMADIAHELRTPVAVLKGEIEAIQDGLRAADENTLASLGEEAEHLSSLVDDLQTLALADAGALDFRMEPVDLVELTSQQLAVFEGRLGERGITTSCSFPRGALINVDSRRTRQLLQNLFENSSRYIIPNGLMELTVSREDGQVTLCIDDSGPGLAPEQMTHLFDRFYRADSSRSRAHGGSGLGLAICRNIVEAQQGTILAETSPLGGLRIRIGFPEAGDRAGESNG